MRRASVVPTADSKKTNCVPTDDLPVWIDAGTWSLRCSGEKTCGIIIEGIQGEGGIFPISTEYLERARELTTRFGALLVFDEIQCGVGRPGAYFSYQLLDRPVHPDVVIAAKPLACGLPLGVIIASDEAASAIAPGMHGSTFGGGPLACRVALEFFDVLDELMPSIVQVGNYFRAELREMAKHFRFIKEVRGAGLMIGVDLDMPGKQFVIDGMAAGLLFNCTHDTVLRFLPPYIITETQVDQALKTLTKLFKKV